VHIHADLPDLPAGAGAVHLVLGGGGMLPGVALAPQGACCELSLPEGLTPDGPAIAMAALRRMGLQPVLVGSRPILGRGLVAAGRSAQAAMVAAGVPKARIAAALEGFGAVPADRPPEPAPSGPDLSVDEILARWLGALANEGFRMLDQGVALRPSDVDLVLVLGYGFPRWRGGPMHLAGRRGLMALRADLRRWAGDDPLWTPAPGLDRLIRDAVRLETLDQRA
jgi:3-hydroxyacyl-CoA dehydrogenase